MDMEQNDTSPKQLLGNDFHAKLPDVMYLPGVWNESMAEYCLCLYFNLYDDILLL